MCEPQKTEEPRSALWRSFDKNSPPLDDYDRLVLWCEMLLEREPMTGKGLADLLWRVRPTFDKDMVPTYGGKL